MDVLCTDNEMLSEEFEGPNGPQRLSAKWDRAAIEVNKYGNSKKPGLKWKEVSAYFK